MGIVYSEDLVSKNNICKTEVEDLHEITLDEVSGNEIEEDSILWVTTVAEASNISEILLHVQDNKQI